MPVQRDAPLNPDGAQARELVRRELAKPAYADQRNWLQRLWDWALDQLDTLLHGIGGALPTWVLLPALLLLAVVVIVALTQLRGRAHAKRSSAPAGVLTDTTLTAAQLRARAEKALAEGDLSSAVLDLFRAIARAAEERALIVPRPGRTAHEVGVELGPLFPGHRIQLIAAANLFDRVRYGDAAASTEDLAALSTLDGQLAATRPQHTVPAEAPA